MKAAARLAAAVALAGCNRYELFRVVGPDPTVPRDADLLFVVDDSESMREESVALAEGFAPFVASLSDDDQGLVDWRIGLTTTDVEGRQGELLGQIWSQDTPDAAGSFVETLLCEAACFPDRGELPSRPNFDCRAPGTFGGEVSQESLDCLCGRDAWLDHCGGGTEQPLEAVLLAMCRSADRTPDEGCEDLPRGELDSVDDFVRPGAALVPIVVTDEGDSSPRVDTLEAWPGRYGQLYAGFGTQDEPLASTWVVVGPTLDDDYELRCPGVAQSWAVQRLRYMVDGTGGTYEDVFASDCGPRPLGGVLTALGDIVRRGGGAVHLPSEPDPDTLAVSVGRRGIRAAEQDGRDVFGQVQWTDGWEYVADTWTVILHGDARPVGDEEVDVYYIPAGRR